MRFWFVYILRCSDGSLYVGISNDVEHRIKRHNAGTGAKYTRSHRPVVLVWSELAETASAARKREAEIKTWPRMKKLKLIQGSHPSDLRADKIIRQNRDEGALHAERYSSG